MTVKTLFFKVSSFCCRKYIDVSINFKATSFTAKSKSPTF